MSLRKKLLLLLAIFFTIAVGYYMNRRYYLEKRYSSIPEKRHKNDVLRIGIIGDSWASGYSLDSILSDEFLKRGIKTEIISFGEPEAKTKDIYDNLYAAPGNPYSSAEILHHNLDYCLILAGTSDAAGEMGAKFYAYYCSLIIGDLLKDHIEPVFVTMPDFGFKEVTDSLGVLKKVRNEVASIMIDNGSTGSLDDYRKQVNEVLKDTHLQDSTIVVPFSLVCDNYHTHKILYRNNSHLSTAGKQKMGRIIVQYIINRMQKRNSGPRPNIPESRNIASSTPLMATPRSGG
ncbi:SGNH/GDSL hydrolase family protein [Mucilaginibacter ginsenosidivorax]|uniref:SGNH/GDSL hydrolase family protein n=1 Tax=Mucilaginibacter ginsenosidivorax TaxID=862126 RepID=A0A5B8W344_9SPHI|nr:hypothetical protein [Mucilaginibacter ginsenosidivorax]QEC76738.1 hypothetical protein FSB76_12540 [Mucilaginibacter ginsenosidivorax]